MYKNDLFKLLNNKKCSTLKTTFKEIETILENNDINKLNLDSSKEDEVIKFTATIIDINEEFMSLIKLKNGKFIGFLTNFDSSEEIDSEYLSNFIYAIGIIKGINGSKIWENLYSNLEIKNNYNELEYPVLIKIYEKNEELKIGENYNFTGILNKKITKENFKEEDLVKNFNDFYHKSIINEITILKYEKKINESKNINKGIFFEFFEIINKIFLNDKLASTLFWINLLNNEFFNIGNKNKDFISINLYHPNININFINELISAIKLIKNNIKKININNDFLKLDNLFPTKCYDFNIIKPSLFSLTKNSTVILIENEFKEEKLQNKGATNIKNLNELIDNNTILIDFGNSFQFKYKSNYKLLSFSKQKSIFSFKLKYKLKNNLNEEFLDELKTFLSKDNNIKIISKFLNSKINDYSDELIDKITTDYSTTRKNIKNFGPINLENIIIITKYYSLFTSEYGDINFENYLKVKNSVLMNNN